MRKKKPTVRQVEQSVIQDQQRAHQVGMSNAIRLQNVGNELIDKVRLLEKRRK